VSSLPCGRTAGGYTVARAAEHQLRGGSACTTPPPPWARMPGASGRLTPTAGAATSDQGHTGGNSQFHGVTGVAGTSRRALDIHAAAVGGGNIECRELVAR